MFVVSCVLRRQIWDLSVEIWEAEREREKTSLSSNLKLQQLAKSQYFASFQFPPLDFIAARLARAFGKLKEKFWQVQEHEAYF